MVTVVQVTTDDQIHKTQELFVEYFDFLRTDVDKVDDLDAVPPLAGYREEIASLPGPFPTGTGFAIMPLTGSKATTLLDSTGTAAGTLA